MLGPEHEFSIIDNELRALPIVDKVLKDFKGRIVNTVKQPTFTFGKELQLHVVEIKPNEPFKSPLAFEKTMQEAVVALSDFLKRKYHAHLLGTGMHPLLRLDQTKVWPHRHRQIYHALGKIFNLQRHGWLNIQSFQLNLPYTDEKDGVLLHNLLAVLCAYLPAVAASSPIYEGRSGDYVDNRLTFYVQNQKEVPSVTGDVVPEYVSSLSNYEREIIGKYSSDLALKGADKILLGNDWINSRGVIFRFDRKALEIRVMDEQECVKSDVALSSFIRATIRGLMSEEETFLSHESLVNDFNSVLRNGLGAITMHSKGKTAREVCRHLLHVAEENATEEEKSYLPLIQKRIERGNLSEIIRERVRSRAQKTDLKEAIVNVYLELVKSLMDDKPYF